MTTFFCPACWRAVGPRDERCPHCAANLAVIDREPFERKLIRALSHPDTDTVMRAVEILGARRSGAAVRPLLDRYLEGGDPYLGAAVARALGRIGGADAREALGRFEQDPSGMVRRAAADALRRISSSTTMELPPRE